MHHFVALMLGAELGARLASELLPELEPLRRAHPHALRLYHPADLHVTLCFVGTLEDERRLPLIDALAEVLSGLPAPRLRLVAPGAFPGRGRERVLWAGVRDEGTGELEALAASVGETCAAAGVELDPRPFRPHVTLARVRAAGRGQVPEAFFAKNPDLQWKPAAASWVLSARSGSEPAYEPAVELPLGPPET